MQEVKTRTNEYGVVFTYTEYNDPDGNEIYEGDIINTTSELVVAWDETNSEWICNCGDISIPLSSVYDSSDLGVID